MTKHTLEPAPQPIAETDGAFDLQVEIHPGDPAVAEVTGEIDIASAPWLREMLLLAIRCHGPEICVDLAGVTFLDCSGINVLLATARRARLEGGRMRVIRPSAPAWRAIRLLNLQGVLSTEGKPGHAPGSRPGFPRTRTGRLADDGGCWRPSARVAGTIVSA
jgi:anti-sigma B factor antagonist